MKVLGSEVQPGPSYEIERVRNGEKFERPNLPPTKGAAGTSYSNSFNLMQFICGVTGWWEWFLTTISDGSMTEFIAVENRSHKHLTRLRVLQQFLFLIRPAFILAGGAADT